LLAGEQLYRQQAFQFLDSMTDSRLSQLEFDSCPCEALMARGGFECKKSV